MKQYIELSEFRAYLVAVLGESSRLHEDVKMQPIEDKEDAEMLFESAVTFEAETLFADEMDSWAVGHAITGRLILPTLDDRVLVGGRQFPEGDVGHDD